MKLLVKKISYPQHPLMKHKNQVVKKKYCNKMCKSRFKSSYKSIRKRHCSPSRAMNNEQVGKGLSSSSTTVT